MKFALFLVGFLTGTLTTYLVLTRVWWPDVRLAATRPAEPATPPSPTPLPFPTPTPPAVGTPSPFIEPTAAASPFPSPSAPAEPLATPIATPSLTGPPAPPPIAPPESKALVLPILETDVDRLRTRALAIPVEGIEAKALRDTFTEARAGGTHQGIDIMALRGTPILAVDDGHVEKLFTSKYGGLTVYQFDPDREYCYYYAHLDSYAAGVEQGRKVKKGDVIGYVGSTGNASPAAPHLHFMIFRLGPDRRWWEGTAINPFSAWRDKPKP